MNYSATLEGIANYVEQSFTNSGKLLPYHNLEHIRAVLEAANELCNHYQVSEEDRFIINAAAWFHDLGILNGMPKNHEERSAILAKDWLTQNGIPGEMITKIQGCIMATRLPQNPQNQIEQIMADSDLWHLGTEKFTEHQKLLRVEKASNEGIMVEKDAWRENNIALLSSHKFQTDYARNLLQEKKEEHLNKMLKKQVKALEPEVERSPKEKKNKKDTDPNIPTRGIETMFRVTIHNHLELSSMADAKANIMISVNSIIVSVVLSVLVKHLEEFPNLIIPTCILLVVNVMTIVFAVLTVRPKILKAGAPEKETPNKRINLLFFGEFNKMNLTVYTTRMKEMMMDKDYLYENMINNIYFMGIVLVKKYEWLRLAYNVFMYGFILAVLAFSIAVMI